MPQVSVREKLIDSAADTFRRRGLRGSSVLDIAVDAGVPKGSLYNHFASKEALAAEVLRRYVTDTTVASLAAAGAGEGEGGAGTAIGRLRTHFESHVARTEGTGIENGCLLGNFGLDTGGDDFPEVKAIVRDSWDAWVDAVAETIATAQRGGEIANRQDPHALASFLISGLEGATLHSRTLGNRSPLDDFLAVTFGSLLA